MRNPGNQETRKSSFLSWFPGFLIRTVGVRVFPPASGTVREQLNTPDSPVLRAGQSKRHPERIADEKPARTTRRGGPGRLLHGTGRVGRSGGAARRNGPSRAVRLGGARPPAGGERSRRRRPLQRRTA